MELADGLLLVAVVACLVTDIRKNRIYNWITLPAAGVGFVINGLVHGGAGLVSSLEGLGLGIALMLIPVVGGNMGAGDLKMVAAIGAIKGPEFVLHVVLAGFIAGGIIALAILIKRRTLGSSVRHIVCCLSGSHCGTFNLSGASMPYAVPLSLGVAISYWMW